MKILAALALVVTASMSNLFAHGSMADPVSRSYQIFLENPQTPQSAAAQAAIDAEGRRHFTIGTRSTDSPRFATTGI